MAEPNKMLEETANYLLNHCFVLGGVEDQRAKYLYVQDHLPEVRAVFAPLGYAVTLYPAPLQAAALVNEHEGSQARLLKYESILLLVLRLLYLQKAGEPCRQRRSGAGHGGRGADRAAEDEPAPAAGPAHAGGADAHPAQVQSGPPGGAADRSGQPHRGVSHRAAGSAGRRPCRCRRREQPHLEKLALYERPDGDASGEEEE